MSGVQMAFHEDRTAWGCLHARPRSLTSFRMAGGVCHAKQEPARGGGTYIPSLLALFLLMRRLGVLPARALGRSAQGSVGSTGRELVQKKVLSLLLHR